MSTLCLILKESIYILIWIVQFLKVAYISMEVRIRV